ncbi:MAG: amino acid permease [Gemmatimonadetes bacterium]|nr:amino acid permease [Gemmatimonadota bacterium]
MMVMGGIIGAGIFINPAVVAERTPGGGVALGAWIVGGAIALAGAFCFAELGARHPRAGGGYAYLRDAFGPLAGFLYGWTLLLIMATGAIAAVAVTFARYFAALVGAPPASVTPTALAAIVLLSGINYLGVRPGAITQNLFTLLKLAALVLLIAAGLLAAPAASPAAVVAVASPPPLALLRALGIALIPILFSYGGWQQTNFVAEEMIEPERSLPRALVLGVIGVVVVYLLANVAYLRQLGHAGLAASAAPAADVLRHALGKTGGTLVTAGIAASTFGFLNLVILVSPRVYQAMAADGAFLHALARLHPRYHSPGGALLFPAGWAVLLTLSGTYGQLLDYVVFGDWIFFGLTAATLFAFRARDPRPTGSGTFRTPGYPLVPALFVLAAAAVVLSSVLSNPRNAAFGTALIALGLPAYAYFRRTSARIAQP